MEFGADAGADVEAGAKRGLTPAMIARGNGASGCLAFVGVVCGDVLFDGLVLNDFGARDHGFDKL